jgi:hypothetical protein
MRQGGRRFAESSFGLVVSKRKEEIEPIMLFEEPAFSREYSILAATKNLARCKQRRH